MRIPVTFVATAIVAVLAGSTAGCRAHLDAAHDGDGPGGAGEASPDPATAAMPTVAGAGADRDSGDLPSATQPEVAAAINDFAAAEGIDAASVHVVAVTPVTWPDSSLGCPSPGEMYSQALVPGYEVRLSGGGGTAVYHTNRGLSGAIALRRCGGGDLVAPSDDPAILERIRADLADRIASGRAAGSTSGSEPVLERSGPAAATSLVCPGTPEVGASGGDLTVQLAVSEVVFRVGADRHAYRVWNGQFIYCGIAPPDEPVGLGTPTFSKD